jgi:hypothetical protein
MENKININSRGEKEGGGSLLEEGGRKKGGGEEHARWMERVEADGCQRLVRVWVGGKNGDGIEEK